MDVSRRGFLRAASMGALGLGGAALVSALNGCAAGHRGTGPEAGGRSGTTTGRTTPPAPDVRLVLAASAAEAELADFCSAALKAQPALSAVLQPLRVRQREHLLALQAAVVGAGPSTAGPSTPKAPRTPTVPRHAADVVDELKRLLSVAERQRFDECLAAESGSLGRMLASVSASHAQSLVVLRRSS